MGNPPDWAIKSALDRIGPDFGGGSVWTVSDIKANAPSPLPYQRMTLLAAKLIATHESPPVDPIEAEVTRLLHHAFGHPPEVIIRTALKAGVALAERERSK